MAQTIRNLVNKSRQRIAAVYSGVDRILIRKSFTSREIKMKTLRTLSM